MATNTTNYNLVMPGYEDTADIQDINDNTEKIDKALGVHDDSIGVVCNGAQCAVAVSSGKFVILRNSTIEDRDDGLYTAAKAIPANEDIDKTYLTAVSDGGLNLIRRVRYMDLTDTTPMNVPSQSSYTITHGNFVGCASRTSGVMPLPYYNNGVMYIKLVNYSDFSPYTGSATVRVWYV